MAMETAKHGAGEEAEVELLLQQELLEHVPRLTNDRGTILSALSSSKALRDAARQLIELLVAKQDLLPASTWNTFPCATRLKISRCSHINDHLYFLAQQLSLLPSHVSSIDDATIIPADRPHPSLPASLAFAKALVASACSSSLTSLEISSALLTPAAADIILQGLPCLQEASLGICPGLRSGPYHMPQQKLWRPRADCCRELLTLQVRSHDTIDTDYLVVDLSGLSTASKLQRLAVHPPYASAVNITALQALSKLQHLDMQSTRCDADSWAVLAKLPKLDTCKLEILGMVASAPAAAVTHLHTGMSLILGHDEAQLSGCLARQLPQLQHLFLGEASTGGVRLARALQGHQQLRELNAQDQEWSTAAWALLAAALPRLETLVVDTLFVDASGLAAAPAAAALRSLHCRFIFNPANTQQQVSGCLARQLPQLQHLVANRTSKQLAAALQGHQQLQSISIQLASQVPAPAQEQEVVLLAALASCSRLQELSVGGCLGMITAADCTALAAGACRESLRVVRLGTFSLDPSCLVPMLRGMPALQRVCFPVPVVPGQGSAVVQQRVQRALPAGGKWVVTLLEDPAGSMMPSLRSKTWECRLTRRGAAGRH